MFEFLFRLLNEALTNLNKTIASSSIAVAKSDGSRRYSVDETGFVDISANGGGAKYLWSEVYHVGVLTTSDGPWSEDVFFVIKTDHGDICISQSHADEIKLLPRFECLPGFNWEQVIKAMGCTDDATFPCWNRSWETSSRGLLESR